MFLMLAVTMKGSVLKILRWLLIRRDRIGLRGLNRRIPRDSKYHNIDRQAIRRGYKILGLSPG